jgi:murein DD-endopeptidase MepM/ murein hydrolase activator NlpD
VVQIANANFHANVPANEYTMNRLRVFPSVVLVFLSACTAVASPTLTQQSILPSPATTPTPTNIATFYPKSAAQTTSATSTPFPVTDAPPLLPTATIGAMQLFFPTVIPAKGAEYRPPLYPIPWALSSYDHFYLSSPIAASYPGDPEWDYRYGGVFFAPDIIHTGVDLPAPRGTDVLAAGPGTVVWAGIGLYTGSSDNVKDPYGLAVAIRHDFGYQGEQLYTIYAHMDEVDVVVGQWLETGDVVGNVGSTGTTTGPHLHFEVRLGENSFYDTRNPELWTAPPQGYGVLVGRVMADYGTTLKNYLVQLKNIGTGQKWLVYTYASDATIHSDAYYNENLVLGGLPAGIYELNVQYAGMNNPVDIQILPGQVTFFSFHGFSSYDFSAPVTPSTGTATPGAS